MLKRRGAGQPPRLIFTADFHELARGQNGAGKCLLRYDPFRLVPTAEPPGPGSVTMFVRFHPGLELWQESVAWRDGALKPQLFDIAGQNYMLKANVQTPEGCDELECWFSYEDTAGQTRWDTDFGKNHWLRFPNNDLEIRTAVLVPAEEAATDRFELSMASVTAVDAVILRWRPAQPDSLGRREVALASSNEGAGGRKLWSTPSGGITVPHATAVIFDLVYGIGGHFQTDDNEDTGYVVVSPADEAQRSK